MPCVPAPLKAANPGAGLAFTSSWCPGGLYCRKKNKFISSQYGLSFFPSKTGLMTAGAAELAFSPAPVMEDVGSGEAAPAVFY